MSGRDDFLSRWSRRKLEARRPEADPVPGPDPEALAPAPETPPPGPGPAASLVRPHDEAAGRPTPADLPAIEELTPEAELTAFLRQGVPEALRNAALRRMWSLDPAIRDFVGDARDYAWDWNTPGGVPGFGPLLPTDDVAGMVADLWGERQNPSEASSDATETSASSSGPREAVAAAAADDAPTPATSEPSVESASVTGPGSAQQEGPRAAPAHHDVSTPPEPATARRHGGARPV